VVWFTVSAVPLLMALVFSNVNVRVAFVVRFPYDDLTHPVAEIWRLAVVWYVVSPPEPDCTDVVVFTTSSGAT
jgi:uncharacterized UPF0146 family protein